MQVPYGFLDAEKMSVEECTAFVATMKAEIAARRRKVWFKVRMPIATYDMLSKAAILHKTTMTRIVLNAMDIVLPELLGPIPKC